MTAAHRVGGSPRDEPSPPEGSGRHRGRVAVLDGGYESYDDERRLLDAAGYDLDIFDGGRHDTPAKIAFARGADGILVRWTVLDGPALDAVPSVRAVVRYGVGYENIDIPAATARGVLVSNVQGYASHSVSDHALALILACVRDLRSGTDDVRRSFGAPPRRRVPELRELSLGIVGLGRIGSALCAKARPLFREVIACDPYIDPGRFAELGALRLDIDELTARADVVSLHCNLTPETMGLFDRARIAALEPGAILVNTSRGPVVDEEALLDALREGRLHAAAADVYHDEPPLADRDGLLAHPRFVGTGHYAWYSSPAARELQRKAAENLAALLGGGLPDDCLNPEALGRGPDGGSGTG